MANLNLSEFTEKLFVADADHTFIWDSAMSISKRVSRNSWLNSGTLTSDAPVTISQTWNGTGSTVFKALVVNATTPGTTSSSSSLLLDLQVGGLSKAYVDKNGAIYGTGVASGLAFKTWVNASQVYQVDLVGTGLIFAGYPGQFYLPASSFMGWNSNDVGSGSVDTKLFRDSPSGNTLALRNGAAAQTFRVYNTYTDASNYERAVFGYGSNQINLGSDVAGSGVHRKLNILGAGIDFYHAGIGIRWSINTSGHFIAAADNTYDIGASGAGRPRNVYVGTSLFTGVGGINFDINARLRSPATDVITLYNNGLSDFGRLQFGGTTNLFPSIKRSSTTLQARLADDSAFAPIQGKLTTETAFTATTVTPTGFITLYDSTGTAYKVPCVPA